MKLFSTLILMLTTLNTFYSQEYTFDPMSDWVTFKDVDNVLIKGYDGAEIIIESSDYDDEDHDDRSKGLKLVIVDGKSDNTNLGLSVINEQGRVIITQVKSSYNSCGSGDDTDYIIKIPSSMNVRYEHSSWSGDELYIEDISGELDVSSNYHDVYLSNVTGPMAVKTVYGTIESDFASLSQEGSISLYSVYEHVDITIPKTSSSNVKLSTTYGNIYSDLEIDVDKTKSGKTGWTGSKIIGKTNSGGVDLLITATYENIYLRSK